MGEAVLFAVSLFGFLGQMGQGVYMEKIRAMMNQLRSRLLVDLTDLRNFDHDLARRYSFRLLNLLITWSSS